MRTYGLIALLCLSAPASAQVDLKVREVTHDDVVRLVAAKQYKPAREVAVQCAERTADPNCQLAAAEFLLQGVGGKVDDRNGLRYLTASAEQGSPAAQALLGNVYHNGVGVKKDPAQAVAWWERSAGNCNPWAQDAVAHSYFDGELVPKDMVKAFHWVSIAAHFEYPEADKGAEKLRSLLTPEELAAAAAMTSAFLEKSGCGTDKPVVTHEP